MLLLNKPFAVLIAQNQPKLEFVTTITGENYKCLSSTLQKLEFCSNNWEFMFKVFYLSFSIVIQTSKTIKKIALSFNREKIHWEKKKFIF